MNISIGQNCLEKTHLSIEILPPQVGSEQRLQYFVGSHTDKLLSLLFTDSDSISHAFSEIIHQIFHFFKNYFLNFLLYFAATYIHSALLFFMNGFLLYKFSCNLRNLYIVCRILKLKTIQILAQCCIKFLTLT